MITQYPSLSRWWTGKIEQVQLVSELLDFDRPFKSEFCNPSLQLLVYDLLTFQLKSDYTEQSYNLNNFDKIQVVSLTLSMLAILR